MKLAVIHVENVKWDCSIGRMINEKALAELSKEFIFVASWEMVALFVLQEGWNEMHDLITDHLSEQYGWLIEHLDISLREAELAGHLFRDRLIDGDLTETLADVCDDAGWDTELTYSERREAKEII